MYTNPQLFNSQKLTVRVYVFFYFNNQRVREYSGRSLNLKIFPGKAKTVAERTSLLKLLRDKLLDSLEAGTYKQEAVEIITVLATLKQALKKKAARLSDSYKRDLTYAHSQFLQFLSEEELTGPLAELSTYRVEEFLDQFNSSNTYYMNKRTMPAALFSTAGRILNTKLGVVSQTERKIPKGVLNLAYTKEQIKPLLNYLQQKHQHLYICYMLTYSSWLRPHIEIRNLCCEHFSENFTTISLGGLENKGGKVRVVYVPEYALKTLREVLKGLKPGQNIFSRTTVYCRTIFW